MPGHDRQMGKRQAIIEEIPRLRRFARGLTGNADIADDLVQDGLERALTHLESWREQSSIRAWLFTIVRNLYLNQLRSAARRPGEAPFDEHEELTSGTPPAQAHGLHLRDLQSALNKLPHRHREVVLLVGVEGMAYKDIALILGIPTGTVMSRLSRGRARLRDLMDTGTKDGRLTLRRVK